MKKPIFILPLALILCFMVSCQDKEAMAELNLQVVDARQAGMDPDRLARIPTRMREFVEEGRIAGAVMLLERRDAIVLLEAVGYQDLETKKPMHVDTIFRVASIAKPVTTIGIMLLQEEGRLAINVPLKRYLPEFDSLQVKGTDTPSRPVTIWGLMTHTSGFASERDIFKPSFLKKSLAEVVAIYAQSPLAYEPGTKFVYSSPGFDTLGRLIEVVSGKQYEAFIEERIFRPLGMKDSCFFVSPEKRGRLASFYRTEDGKLHKGAKPNSFAGDLQHEGRVFPAPAFGLYSTAPDLGAMLQMMLSGGTYNGRRILSQASVTAMTVDKVMDEKKPPWGLGWTVTRQAGTFGYPFASSRAYGHGGSTGVFIWADPEKDLAGVFLIHQAGQESWHVGNIFMTMAATAIADY